MAIKFNPFTGKLDFAGSDAHTPTGPAGGDLTGTYPNPTIANGAVTNTKLANSSITINGTPISLGGSTTISPLTIGAVPQNTFQLFEHFFTGNVGMTNLQSYLQGSGAFSSALAANTFDSDGVVTLATGTTLALSSTALGCNPTNANPMLFGTGKKRFLSRCAFSVLPSSAAQGIWVSGFVSSFTATSSNGLYFRTQNGGNLFAVASNSGFETVIDMGFAPDTTGMHTYEVYYDGTNACFYYDNTLVATISTNIPLGLNGRTDFGVALTRTQAVATSLQCNLDFVFMQIENQGFIIPSRL